MIGQALRMTRLQPIRKFAPDTVHLPDARQRRSYSSRKNTILVR